MFIQLIHTFFNTISLYTTELYILTSFHDDFRFFFLQANAHVRITVLFELAYLKHPTPSTQFPASDIKHHKRSMHKVKIFNEEIY